MSSGCAWGAGKMINSGENDQKTIGFLYIFSSVIDPPVETFFFFFFFFLVPQALETTLNNQFLAWVAHAWRCLCLTRLAGRSPWADLIASRIPPGQGWWSRGCLQLGVAQEAEGQEGRGTGGRRAGRQGSCIINNRQTENSNSIKQNIKERI